MISSDWEYLVKLVRQYLQGNTSQRIIIKSRINILSVIVGLSGYIAVMEWRNFHPLGPQNLVFILVDDIY